MKSLFLSLGTKLSALKSAELSPLESYMLNLKKLQTSTALALTLGMTTTGVAPLIMANAATATPAPIKLAQLFPQRNTNTNYYGTVRIPAGTVIRLAYNDAEKIVVAPNETQKITLTVPNNIRASNGALLIPAGSKVDGEFRPAGNNDATQFVAQTLTLPNGNRLNFDAQSDVISRTEEIRRGVNTDAILKGAAIGSGAAAIISGVTGNRRITLGKILIGAGAGGLGGLLFGRNNNRVVVVNPRTDLGLRLNSSLAVNPY